MVKNTTGGNKSKSQARKFVGGSSSNNRLRIALDEGEIYGQVVKIFGSMNCSVIGTDNITRRCIIRGKFRGKGKRDNMIRPGTWVLIGEREWESQTCDLLEVYSDTDKEKLKTQVLDVNWKIFIANDFSNGNNSIANDENLIFSDAVDEEYANIVQNIDPLMPSLEEEVCIDDI